MVRDFCENIPKETSKQNSGTYLMTGSVTHLCPTLVIKWSTVYQFLLPIGLSWQEYWSGLPFPTPYLMTGLCQRERRETKVSSVSDSTPVRFCDIPFILSFCKGNLMSSLVAQLVKNLTDNSGNTRDAGLIPESGTFPGEGNENPFQYSCLETSWTEEPGGLQSMGS